MKNIKFNILGLFVFAALLTGCGKENEKPPTYASVMLVNAALSSTSKPLTSFYVNDSLYTPSFIAYNSNTGYIGILPGVRTITLRQDNGTYSATAPIIATDGPAQYNENELYSLFSFDSLTTGNTVKFLKLRDDLTPPTAINTAKVRFLQLAPNYPSTTTNTVDVTFVRYAGGVAVDSVTQTNRAFPTSNSAAAYQDFVTLNSGGYVIKLKTPGTQTVLFQKGTVGATGSISVGSKRIITFYTNGTAAGRPFDVFQITNF